jgi:hypothetical protein
MIFITPAYTNTNPKTHRNINVALLIVSVSRSTPPSRLCKSGVASSPVD